MTRASTKPKCDSQALFLFPGSSEEQDWRPIPPAVVKHQPQQEDRSCEQDIERWDGLS